ncbi:hypothetical protein L2E82_21285 [Cichorium intybus]|uniref:Uncharacterized protein n=1 Tax=Cichorium intybus TaxID=13427 RepID=A0ACB9DWA3_CICIN|nr:hypothetical protein L2E82_21285 [Cichorium intybus]
MMKMSSSTSKNRVSSEEILQILRHLNHNHKHLENRCDNNSGVFHMSVDGLLPSIHNNNEPQAPETTLLDAEITLLDATGVLTAIKDTETAGTFSHQEIGCFLSLATIVVYLLFIFRYISS